LIDRSKSEFSDSSSLVKQFLLQQLLKFLDRLRTSETMMPISISCPRCQVKWNLDEPDVWLIEEDNPTKPARSR